jgi:tartrate dehydrogenase/decarboxylase / D-malate dehydrogenase
MAVANIAVVAGDGIGPEVIEQAIRVTDAALKRDGVAFAWNHLPWNSAFYKKTGKMLPDDGWDTLARHDAILFGAIGSPDVPDSVTVNGLLLPMRRKFDLYVNLRPACLFDGVQSPLRDKAPGSINMLVYRENTEGEYAPIGGRLYVGTPHETALQTSVFTRRGCERIMRAAFEAARKRPRKKLTSITKANAQVHTLGLWDEVHRDIAREYPDVQSHSLLVDAAAMDLVRKPESFDVIVASNLFGDILTDLSAIVTGSVGLGASANLNPERAFPSMFEPLHGSAPDIAGKGIANPLAAILSAELMLDHLGHAKSAAAVHKAIACVLREAIVRTPDLGGKATTSEMGDAVIDAIAGSR